MKRGSSTLWVGVCAVVAVTGCAGAPAGDVRAGVAPGASVPATTVDSRRFFDAVAATEHAMSFTVSSPPDGSGNRMVVVFQAPDRSRATRPLPPEAFDGGAVVSTEDVVVWGCAVVAGAGRHRSLDAVERAGGVELGGRCRVGSLLAAPCGLGCHCDR